MWHPYRIIRKTMSHQNNEEDSRQQARRRLMKSVTASGVGLSILPKSWGKPLVDSVVLPAHAQTTDDSSDSDSGGGARERAFRTGGMSPWT
ncbi:MAG: hypothetical protein ACI8P9_003933 [Parasphingorhabdus sp.]|jgi:hypothetical protein